MAKYKGVGASDGIAVAKIFKLVETKLDVKKTTITNTDQELKILNDAIKKAEKDLKKLIDITLKKLGEEKAEIFKAHEMILNDPEIINEIKQLVEKDKVNLAYAVLTVKDKYVATFKAMNDPYFEERSADVEDVYTRLLKYVLKVPVLDLATINEEVIIAAVDLTPSQTAQLNPKYVKGFICNIGGRTSHAAIMARSLEIPAVLGLKNITSKTNNGDLAIIDGSAGFTIVSPTKSEVDAYNKLKADFLKEKQELLKFINKETISKDGKKYLTEGNIGSVKDVDGVVEHGGQGVGLFRSEFLYMDNSEFPTEEEQFKAYKEVLTKMKNKIVVIRTLDIGGDKTLSYFQFPKELNPFLGYRAIRLCLDKTEIFKTQIRALLRASAFGKLAIMFPMIATVEEFKAAKKITLEEKAKLVKKGVKVSDDIQIGMMMEVPAAAINANVFAKYSDFFSIGTNDLIQYSFAADRMSEYVSYLYQPYNPAVLKLVKQIIDSAHKEGKWVGMCGEVAGDAKAIPLLMGLGLDAFSMSSTSILKARKIISTLDSNEMKSLVNEAIELESNEEVLKLVNKKINF